jgi:hypothetical protein
LSLHFPAFSGTREIPFKNQTGKFNHFCLRFAQIKLLLLRITVDMHIALPGAGNCNIANHTLSAFGATSQLGPRMPNR